MEIGSSDGERRPDLVLFTLRQCERRELGAEDRRSEGRDQNDYEGSDDLSHVTQGAASFALPGPANGFP